MRGAAIFVLFLFISMSMSPLVSAATTETQFADGTTTFSHSFTSATGGDPFISFDVLGVAGWHIGIDNSDHDKLKFGTNWSTVGNDTALAIDRSKNSVFSGSVTATSFSGNGSGLTAVNATSVDGIDSGSFLRSDANDSTCPLLQRPSSNSIRRISLICPHLTLGGQSALRNTVLVVSSESNDSSSSGNKG